MHSNFLAQPKYHNEKFNTLDPYKDHVEYQNQVDAQKIIQKQTKTINTAPDLTIEHGPSTARNNNKRRKKRNLLNHSMAKDMHNGKIDDSIFIMSNSFRNSVAKAACNSSNVMTQSNSRSCLRRNSKNPLILSFSNQSPRKLFMTDDTPNGAYQNINQEVLDVGIKRDDTDVNPMTDI